MVNFLLQIAADLENIASLQPHDGCDDANITYYFKLKCNNCGEVSEKETCISLSDTVPLPNGRGTANLVRKCKFCGREGTLLMIPGKGRPLTDTLSDQGQFAPLMLFECRGLEPIDYFFGDGWKVESVHETTFTDIDLSPGDYVEYDEKGQCPVGISNLRSEFVVVK
ncbi:uncharacterized protein [Aristolochia californica]|uniref:uncharacterized protein n=1 Tax=Aristolochia californica TaxID=171875 RepID=UPI0035E16788